MTHRSGLLSKSGKACLFVPMRGYWQITVEQTSTGRTRVVLKFLRPMARFPWQKFRDAARAKKAKAQEKVIPPEWQKYR